MTDKDVAMAPWKLVSVGTLFRRWGTKQGLPSGSVLGRADQHISAKGLEVSVWFVLGDIFLTQRHDSGTFIRCLCSLSRDVSPQGTFSSISSQFERV